MIGELRREHFVDERAIVRQFERQAPQDHVGSHRRVAVVEVDEGLHRALPAADDGDTHRLAAAAGLLGHVLQVLAVVGTPAVALLVSARNTCGIGGVPPTDHQARVVRTQFLAVGVARSPARSTWPALSIGSTQDLFAVAALLLEVAGDPAQVVVEPIRQEIEGAQVDEVGDRDRARAGS